MTVTLQELPIEQVRPHPHNIRRDWGDLSELADSIRAQGVLEPVRVSPDVDPSVRGYVLSAGHRRLAAAAAAGLDTIPALVRDGPISDVEAIEEMLVENGRRADLSPVEEAAGYQQLVLLGDYDVAAIARVTGRSADTVRRRMALLELPEPVRERVHVGQITLAQAEQIGAFADDPDTVAELEKAIDRDDDGRELRWRLEQEQARRDRAAQREAKLGEYRAAGVRVVDAMPEGAYRVEWMHPTPKDHAAGCKHHAVVDSDGYLFEVCLKPSVHQERAPRLSKEEKAAREQADAERRQLQEELQVAAKVRDEWLHELLSPSRTPTTAQVEALLRQVLVNGFEEGWVDEPVWREKIGLPPLTDDADQVEAAEDELSTWIAAWSLPRLAQALWAATLGDPGSVLVHAYQWDRGGFAYEVLPRLVALGYQPTELEHRLYDEHLATQAAAAEASQGAGDGELGAES